MLKLLCSYEIFPSGYVINYKTCTLPTHSSPCQFAPFVFASTFISLYSLAPSSEFPLSLSLSCSLSPHFTPSFCLLCVPPFKFFFFHSPSRSLLDLWLFVCVCSLSQGFCLFPSICLFRSLKPSHLFVLGVLHRR